MGHPDEGEYVSFDVDAFGAAVDDLDETLSGLRGRISGLDEDFSFFGVDRANLKALLEAKRDLEEIMPDMRRRHSRAEHILSQQQSGGWATDGVIRLQGSDILNDHFDSIEEAQQAGRDLADLVNGSHGDIPDEVWEQLSQYGHDPDFAEAFVDNLTAADRGLLLMAPSDSSLDIPDTAATALTGVFSTASFRIDYDEDFYAEMYDALLEMDLHPDGLLLVDSMADLMQTGTWNHEAVVHLAESAFMSEKTTSGRVENWSAIYHALARNPRAAAEFMDAHSDEIWEQAQYGGPPHYEEDYDAAFAAFIQAATVDAHSIYARMGLHDEDAPNLAEKNAVFWISSVGGLEEPHPFTDEMRAVFGEITAQYWDEFMYVFSSPAGVADYEDGEVPIDGIDLETWQGFLTEAMRSNEGAARLLDLFYDQVGDTRSDRARDYDPEDELSAGESGWQGFINSQLSSLYMEMLGEVLDGRQADLDARNEARDDIIDWVVDHMDPSKLKDVPKDAAKNTLKQILKHWANDSELDDLSHLDTDLLGPYQAWVEYAVNLHEHGNITYGEGPVIRDPAYYAERYGNGESFLDAAGNILPLDEIRKDPDKLAAFNAWLQDPNVQRHTRQLFIDES